MNWDKTSIFAAILGVAAIVCWYAFFPGAMPKAPQTPPAAAESAKPSETQGAKAPAKTAPAIVAAEGQVADMPTVSIAGGEREYVFQPATGTLQKVVMQSMQNASRTEPLVIENEYPALAGVGAEFGAFGLRTADGALTTVKILKNERVADDRYVLERLVRTPADVLLVIEETFFADQNGQLLADVAVRNPDSKPVQVPRIVIAAGDLAPWFKLSGDERSRSQELHTLDYCTESGSAKYVDSTGKDKKFDEVAGTKVRWLGSSNRFFALLFKEKTSALELVVERVKAGDDTYVLAPAGAIAAFTLAPDAEKKFTFDYYLGSKNPDALKAFDPTAKKVMRLGWFPIDFIAYIMLVILNWFHSFIGSFGWSIILLTLLVRTIFFPVTMKANASMRDMSALSPKIKEIREKYKDEPMVAQTKMQELYREHHINPLGGCLPMLIQIPVFIALYYALGSCAELRQQSFWWIKDLAQPDTVAHLFSLPINPLIIAWTLLMVVQQRLTPSTMDPAQAKMMLVMPIVMLFFLYSLPAGLTLYWTVSQIFSICQMLYQQKMRKREERNKQSGAPQSDSKAKIVRS